MSNIEKCFKYIEENITEEEVYESIDENIPNYVDDDWDDDFDSEYECYVETGRGEAESDVIDDLILNVSDELKIKLSIDERSELEDIIKDHFCL